MLLLFVIFFFVFFTPPYALRRRLYKRDALFKTVSRTTAQILFASPLSVYGACGVFGHKKKQLTTFLRAPRACNMVVRQKMLMRRTTIKTRTL